MDGIVLIDKIEGTTSYDVVKCVKALFHTRKVGHCGTLDPFASGLLIIGINQGTKILTYLEHDFKEYIATIQFGTSTDTYDKDGKVVSESVINEASDVTINEVLNSFKGVIEQTPPIYSSIHIDGKHLYEYARNNQEVEIPTRNVEIFDIKLLENNKENIKIYVKCSRGTYIRSLGLDIAKKLNNDGHLTQLRRISIGNLNVDNANTFIELKEGNVNLKEIKDAVSFKQITLKSPAKMKRVYNGQPITLTEETSEYIMIMDENKAIAVYNLKEDGQYYCQRGLFDEEIRFARIKELSF